MLLHLSPLLLSSNSWRILRSRAPWRYFLLCTQTWRKRFHHQLNVFVVSSDGRYTFKGQFCTRSKRLKFFSVVYLPVNDFSWLYNMSCVRILNLTASLYVFVFIYLFIYLIIRAEDPDCENIIYSNVKRTRHDDDDGTVYVRVKKRTHPPCSLEWNEWMNKVVIYERIVIIINCQCRCI